MILAVGHRVGSAVLPLASAPVPVPLEGSPVPSTVAIRQQLCTAAQNAREMG